VHVLNRLTLFDWNKLTICAGSGVVASMLGFASSKMSACCEARNEMSISDAATPVASMSTSEPSATPSVTTTGWPHNSPPCAVIATNAAPPAESANELAIFATLGLESQYIFALACESIESSAARKSFHAFVALGPVDAADAVSVSIKAPTI